MSIDSEEEGHLDERILLQNDQPEASADFTKVSFTLSKKIVEKIGESPYAYTRKILKAIPADANPGVSYDPDIWFRNFTQTTFLGRAIDNPIHIGMAQLLVQVENSFLDLHPEFLRASKYDLGTLVGLSTDDKNDYIRGARTYPKSAIKSYHLFGLALDMNYTGNVFIQNWAAFNKFLIKISALVTGTKPDLIDFKAANENTNMSVEGYLQLRQQMEDVNTIFKTYCSLQDNDPLLEQRLAASTSSHWQGKTAAHVKRTISNDISDLAIAWSRHPKNLGQNGFFNLSAEFVRVMVENGFDWGARYGDLMHFDMRRTALGKPIEDKR